MLISIATVRPRAARMRRASGARLARRPRRVVSPMEKSAGIPGFLSSASNAQCDVKHSRWQRKISDSLQMPNHSRFLNPIEKRLTGAQYFAMQEWHDAVRRRCTNDAPIEAATCASIDAPDCGGQRRNVFSAFARHRRTHTRSAG